MFDSGFSEIMLIMIVALIVVGPERLPGLARKAGYWVGKFRRYVSTVRSEIERELNADELRSMLTKQEDEIRELRDMLHDTRSQIRHEVDDINREVSAAGEQLHHDAIVGHASQPEADKPAESKETVETAAAKTSPAVDEKHAKS